MKECWGIMENMIADQMDAAGYDCFDEESIREYWEKEERLYDPSAPKTKDDTI